MDLEHLSYLATTIGALSIPLSGVFIWLQLRQQTRLATVANTQALVDLSSPFNLQLIQDKEMARLWVLGAREYGTYDEVQKYRYRSLLIWWLLLHENIFLQRKSKLLDPTVYDSWHYDLQAFARVQLAEHWAELRPAFQKEFAEHIDELCKPPNEDAAPNGRPPPPHGNSAARRSRHR
jgi:hypothetical protein